MDTIPSEKFRHNLARIYKSCKQFKAVANDVSQKTIQIRFTCAVSIDIPDRALIIITFINKCQNHTISSKRISHNRID